MQLSCLLECKAVVHCTFSTFGLFYSQSYGLLSLVAIIITLENASSASDILEGVFSLIAAQPVLAINTPNSEQYVIEAFSKISKDCSVLGFILSSRM